MRAARSERTYLVRDGSDYAEVGCSLFGNWHRIRWRGNAETSVRQCGTST